MRSFGDHWNVDKSGTSLSSSFPPGHHQKSDIRRRPMPFQSHFWCVFFGWNKCLIFDQFERCLKLSTQNPTPCNATLMPHGSWTAVSTNRNSRFVALCKVPPRILCRKEMIRFYNTDQQSNKRLQEPLNDGSVWFILLSHEAEFNERQFQRFNDRAIHGTLAIVAPEEVREVTSKGSYLSDAFFFFGKIETRRSKNGHVSWLLSRYLTFSISSSCRQWRGSRIFCKNLKRWIQTNKNIKKSIFHRSIEIDWGPKLLEFVHTFPGQHSMDAHLKFANRGVCSQRFKNCFLQDLE